MKVTTSLTHRKNQKLTIQGVEVFFDKDLIAEVSEEDAAIIMSKDSTIKPLGETLEDENKSLEDDSNEESKTDNVEDDSKKGNESDNKEGDEDNSDESEGLEDDSNEGDDSDENEDDEEDVDLSSLKVVDLQAICEEANFPKDEWKNLKKDELIGYIQSK